MAGQGHGGCACCGSGSIDAGPEQAAARTRFLAGVEQLGIGDEDRAGLATLWDGGDCAALQSRLAVLVETEATVVQERLVGRIEQAARSHSAASGPGVPGSVIEAQREAVDLNALAGRLQQAGQVLREPSTTQACGEGCVCSVAVSDEATLGMPVRVPASRMALTTESAADGSDIVCTLEGGTDAMQERIGAWQNVLSKATGRLPADGGVTLTYQHDPAVTLELARLAVAEYACCSFFTFSLTLGPDGMRFTVTAPPEAHDVVTAVFGTA